MAEKQNLLNILNEKQKDYDYSLIPNKFPYKDKISVICHKHNGLGEEHGVFYTTFDHLRRGDGCPKCNGKYMTKEEFVSKAQNVHGAQYDYEKFVFVNKSTKGIIHCKKHDIDFLQTPAKHLAGHACPKCRYEKSASHKRHDTKWFITKAREIHGEKYDYSKVKYIKGNEKVEITCPVHGLFRMMPFNHIHSTHPQGCPKCGRENSEKKRTYTKEEFVERAREVHGDKYGYSKTEYTNNRTKVCITCPEHGDFWQEPSNHLLGQNCPRCSKTMSQGEKEVYDFCCQILGNDNVKQRYRGIFHDDREIDIYIPAKKIAIEYDGLIWHSEKFNKDKLYHLKKTLDCEKQGIRLIHIFEDEWLDKQEITKSRLKNILSLTEDKIYARKCTIREIDSHTSAQFMEANHLQGKCKGKHHIGLFNGDVLVSVMIFGHLRQMRKNIERFEESYELLRFANKINLNVVGGASKILKYFINKHKPYEITSYADRRWSDGKLYETLGFTHTHNSRPNYFYIIGRSRGNRFNFRKKNLVKKGFDADKSEHQIMIERGLYRIYDCGCMCYKWQT